MTTSGTATFNPSIQTIVDGALRKVGAIAEGETSASTNLYTDSALALNSMIKAWMASGLHVWTEEEGIQFLQPGQARYLIGGTTTDQAGDANSWVQSPLTLTAAAGATVIMLTSAVGVANGQPVGVVLDNGTTFWTTVNGAPIATSVVLSQALPSQASVGKVVLSYPAKLVRPLKMPNARQLTLASLNETPMVQMSRQEYMDLPNKGARGVPTQFFYAPKLNSGELYVWPVPTITAWAVRFTWYRPIYDVTDPSQTVDFPQEWILPLTWALAEEMAPEFDVPPPRWSMIRQKSAEAKDMAACWDRETEDVQFGMSWDGR